jgi:23S rRNA (cytidine1920-2'-O)/16S rRNA (cytidine1409-2'-O)-methyltransferase
VTRIKKVRADVLVLERGLADSRTKAQAMIMAGQVFRGETRIEKPGDKVYVDAELRVSGLRRFVSRGGDKLDHALTAFDLDVHDKIAVDVGSSTGGFSDCLLQRGAARIYAVDVGRGQLHQKLLQDERVICRERTNARHLGPDDFDDSIDLVVVDASFIGIDKLIGAIASFLQPGGDLVVLIKPQFEVGKAIAQRFKGVIRDPAIRQEAIDAATRSIEAAGFEIVGARDSALRGPKGNLEHLVWAKRHPAP